MNLKEEQYDVIIKNISENIKSNIEILDKNKQILLSYVAKIVDFSTENVDTFSVNTLMDFLNNLKNNLCMIDENNVILNNFQDKIKSNTITINNDLESCLDNYLKEYSQVERKWSDSLIKLDDFILNASAFFILSFGIYDVKKIEYKNISGVLENNHTSTLPTNKTSTKINSTLGKNTSYIDSKILNNKSDNKCNNSNESNNKRDNTSSKNITINNNVLEENTLLILESDKKVILPYTMEELNSIMESGSYSDVNEIINKKYTVPYSYYRNSIFARFKEAYKLVRNKEHKTIREAFDLGFELMFNYSLYPAIITACKNLDQLDLYLDYLEANETEKFDCFKIKFVIPPAKKTTH